MGARAAQQQSLMLTFMHNVLAIKHYALRVKSPSILLIAVLGHNTDSHCMMLRLVTDLIQFQGIDPLILVHGGDVLLPARLQAAGVEPVAHPVAVEFEKRLIISLTIALPGEAIVRAVAVAQTGVGNLPPAQPSQQGHMVLDVPGPSVHITMSRQHQWLSLFMCAACYSYL